MLENSFAGELTSSGDFGPNPGQLRMLTYVPAGLSAGAPLVVALHGCGQSAAAFCRGAGWMALAKRLGFVLLAPEQSASNNFNGCFNWFQPADAMRGRGEAASIAQMVERAIRDHGVDRSRLFITGFSAGGGMAAAMLAVYPELFAGGAILAGVAYGAALNMHDALGAMRQSPTHSAHVWGEYVRDASAYLGPWPKVSVWQGGADRIVSAKNADAITTQWANVHGLSAEPTTEEKMDDYSHRAWRDPSGGVVLEAYTLKDMGHGVPIALEAGDEGGAPGRYMLDVGVSSTERIAAFWGLLPAAAPILKPRLRQAANTRSIPIASKPHIRASATTQARRVPMDLQTIIEGALKTAGVLKRR